VSDIDLTSIISADISIKGSHDNRSGLDFHAFAPTDRYAVPPVLVMPSPDPRTENSIRNLLSCALDFLDKPHTRTKRGTLLQEAREQGWLFFSIEDFMSNKFPLSSGGNRKQK